MALTLYNKIRFLLDSLEIGFLETDHLPVYNGPDVIAKLNTDPEEESKSLVIIFNKSIAVVTIPIDEKLAPSSLRSIGIPKFKFLPAHAFVTAIDIQPGAVAPFGYNDSIHCFISSVFLSRQEINFNPGVNDKTFQIGANGLQDLLAAGFINLL